MPSPGKPLRLDFVGNLLRWLGLAAGLVALSALLAYAPKFVFGAAVGVMIAALGLFARPANVLGAVVIISFVFVGPLETLGRVDRVFWVIYLACGYLGVLALIARLGATTDQTVKAGVGLAKYRVEISVERIALWSLVAIGAASTLAAGVGLPQMVLATRDYLWLWGAFAIVAATRMPSSVLTRIFGLLSWVVVVQVPLIIYQRYAVAAGRVRSWDAVVGIFGGDPDGGGASGAMALFSLLMAAYAVVRVRQGLATAWYGLAICVAAVISIGLAEVKFVVMIAPVIFLGVIGLSATLRNPRIFSAFLLVLVLSPLVLYGYWASFETRGSKGHRDFTTYVETIIQRNTDDRDMSFRSIEMGRVAALKFWQQEVVLRSKPVEMVIGHGIGSTRTGAFPGEVAKRYPFKVARSSLAVLLWELGFAGTILAICLLLVQLWRAGRISLRSPSDRAAREDFAAGRLATGCMLASLLFLPYNTDLVGTPQYQLLFVLCCAFIWRAREASASTAVGRNSQSARPSVVVA